MLCQILDAFIEYIANEGGFEGISEEEEDGNILQHSLGRSHNHMTRFEVADVSSKNQGLSKQDDDEMKHLFGKLFMFAFVWSFGGHFDCTMEDDDEHEFISSNLPDSGGSEDGIRHKFDEFARDLIESNPSLNIQLPVGNRMLFSYYVDVQKNQFVLWDSLVKSAMMQLEKTMLRQDLLAASDSVKTPASVSHGLIPTGKVLSIFRFSTLSSTLP